MNQMADDVERTPGARTLNSLGPCNGKILEQRTQNCGRPLENRKGLVKSKVHHMPPTEMTSPLAGGAGRTRKTHRPHGGI